MIRDVPPDRIRTTQRDRLAHVRALDPQALRQRYEEGASTVDLTVAFGISRTTVRTLLVQAGTRLRTISEARDVRDAHIWFRLPKPDPVEPGMSILDVEGVAYEVTASTPTRHGFDVLRGRPVRRRGRSSIILSEALAAHLERHRLTPGRLDLPISDRMVLMLRRRLAYDSRAEKRAWWEDHRAELAASDPATLEALAGERGIDPASAACLRLRLCGLRRPPQASWLNNEAKALILSDRSRAELSAIFGLTPIYISFLRKKLRDAAAREAEGGSIAGTSCMPRRAECRDNAAG